MKWQDVAKILGPGSVGIIFVLAGILNLTGMYHTIPPDIKCTDCYSLVEVNSTYWEIKAEHRGDKPILDKKMTRSRTLWVNLDRVDEFILTNPKVPVEILVPTVKRYSTIKHPEFGYLRPLKDGDALIARKNKYNPNGDRFVVHGLTSGQTVKWGMTLEHFLSGDIDFDPIWESPEFAFDLIMNCWNETKEKTVPSVKEIFIDCSLNMSCPNSYYINQTSYIEIPYKVEHCKEIGVLVGGKEILYKQERVNCLRTDSTLCCWDYRDGGTNIEDRKTRTEIISGESGFCKDLNDNLKGLSYRSDWGDLGELKEVIK